MDESTKKLVLIAVAVVAVVIAGYSAFRAFTPQEEIVGHIEIGQTGFPVDTTASGQAAPQEPPQAQENADASGMPADMR
jgi:hypothetical protein